MKTTITHILTITITKTITGLRWRSLWGTLPLKMSLRSCSRLITALLLLLSLSLNAQTTRQLKVFQKTGMVDVVPMNDNSAIRHSCTDLNGQEQQDYVTIPTVQAQTGADNTDHIGHSGDCGTAIASLTTNPQSLTPNYSFTLQHKAAYLCFLPLIDHLPSVKVTKIQLSCNEAIAGTYQLSLTGLYNPANTSKKIMLDLNAQRLRDFFLGHQIITEQDMCAAYMVIAPQTAKRNFTATYFLTDTLSRLTTTYQQKFSFQPVANTVYPVVCHIPESLFQSIDLGFDHLWSNVNLGSNIPNEAGNNYAWGEVTSKGDFSSSNYTANVSSEVLDICGTEYDPVSQSSLGSSWQMPTADEMDELIDLCHWEWTEYNWLGTREDAVNGNASALVLSRESKQKALMQGWQGMNIRPVKTIWREFNIPYSGIQYIDLRSHGPGYNIKVYDYGGPNDNYVPVPYGSAWLR